MPVAGCMIVTAAWATTEPLASVTVPRMPVSMVCDSSVPTAKHSKIEWNGNEPKRCDFILTPPRCLFKPLNTRRGALYIDAVYYITTAQPAIGPRKDQRRTRL